MEVVVFMIVGVALLIAGKPAKAFAHGYVESPRCRAYMYENNTSMVGGCAYEPQSLEAPKGFPAEGPMDGRIASANCSCGCEMDRQTSTMWTKNNLQTGPNLFYWFYKAPHPTTKWEYFITKQGWDQNSALTRASFDLTPIAVIQGNMVKPPNGTAPPHNVFIPTDRTGYHIILAVWTIGDTANAFYNVIDVNLGGGGGTPPPVGIPPAIENFHAHLQAPNTVQLTWSASPSGFNVTGYRVYRSINFGTPTLLSTTSGNSFTDTNLPLGSTVQYYVAAINSAGEGPESSIATIEIPGGATPPPPTQVPPAVQNLTASLMGSDAVHLSWTPVSSSYNWGRSSVDGYRVYRSINNAPFSLIATTSASSYHDATVTPGSNIRYYVTAFNSAGEGAPSQIANISTPGGTTPPPGNFAEWNAGAYYQKGDVVSFNGRLYQALVTFQGYGDYSWNPEEAISLWAPYTAPSLGFFSLEWKQNKQRKSTNR